MKPKYRTAQIEGRTLSMHMTAWADKLAEYYYMSRSQFDKLLSGQFHGDLQAMINHFQTPHWREKNLFLYGKHYD